MTDPVDGSAEALVGRVLDDKYRLERVLGEGGMGVVYRSRSPEGRDVAVKVLRGEFVDHEETRQRFERETNALFALKHPHVLEAFDAGVVDGCPYLVMELLDGEPLDKTLEDGPLAPAEALRLIRQVMVGLAFAHGKGAAHRDLKSENVFLSRKGGETTAKLLDFGLVKFTDEEAWGDARKLTVQGSVFGTPAYMAPEQALGKETDARTDVYAVGCILFELLTGEWPFMEETQLAMLQAQILKQPRLVADTNLELAVRPELDAFIQRAMAKKPAQRFADAQAMLDAFDALPQPPVVLRPSDGTDPFAVRAAPAAPTSPATPASRPERTHEPRESATTLVPAGAARPHLAVLVAGALAIVALGAALAHLLD